MEPFEAVFESAGFDRSKRGHAYTPSNPHDMSALTGTCTAVGPWHCCGRLQESFRHIPSTIRVHSVCQRIGMKFAPHFPPPSPLPLSRKGRQY